MTKEITMVKKILLGVGAVILVVVGFVIYTISTTENHSPKDTVSASIGALDVSLSYCRPYKKDRVIFGELVPYGVHWRTGANSATEITFSGDVMFGDKAVKAGTYRLYTIPNQNSWEVVLNSELKAWGYFEPKKELDVESITVPVKQVADVTEQFTISFETEGDVINSVFKWDQTVAIVPISPIN